MKKWKFFLSVLKERDWLEDMARQGYILTDINLGMRYHFKECEPCEKVYEIERFAISSQPTVSELTARKIATDIAIQSGWEIVAHDKEMNYYFVKDKANDETDEFYDDETRQERAERYRKRYFYDLPKTTLTGIVFFSVFYFIIFLAFMDTKALLNNLMWFYFVFTTFEIFLTWMSMHAGNKMYNEFLMSREEWESHKNHNQKKSFKKIQQLRVFLQEQSEKGLALTGFKDKYYTFENDSRRYDYFVDTNASLRKRMKQQGKNLVQDKKDLFSLGLKWYELSIEDASKYNLKPVAVIGNNIIIYKRPFSDEKIPWENGNENLSAIQINPLAKAILIGLFALGFIIGFIWCLLAL